MIVRLVGRSAAADGGTPGIGNTRDGAAGGTLANRLVEPQTMSASGHLQPDGSLSSDSFRAGRMSATAERQSWAHRRFGDPLIAQRVASVGGEAWRQSGPPEFGLGS